MIRVSPPELARELAGPCCSTSVTLHPLWRNACAIHAPKTPAPTTVAEGDDMLATGYLRSLSRGVSVELEVVSSCHRVVVLWSAAVDACGAQRTGPKVAVSLAVWQTKRRQLPPNPRLS